MTRKQALEIAARIIGNMILVRTKRDYRTYQGDLNYLADSLQRANGGVLDEKLYQRL